MKDKLLFTSAVLCKKCGAILFSRAIHDYRTCPCGEVSIDGGFDYCKLSYKKEEDFMLFKIAFPKNITKKLLHDDWNNNKNNHGLYKIGEYPTYIQKGLLEEVRKENLDK